MKRKATTILRTLSRYGAHKSQRDTILESFTRPPRE
jgi:hypothetical protein